MSWVRCEIQYCIHSNHLAALRCRLLYDGTSKHFSSVESDVIQSLPGNVRGGAHGKEPQEEHFLVKGREEEGETRWRCKERVKFGVFCTSGSNKQKPPAFPHKAYL
ncbi:hypothetical protein MHYP_G00214950 [Metynnis hypsauchen]